MATQTKSSKAARRHPQYSTWREAEARQRASFIATREALVPYLVPHFFEGAVDGAIIEPENLSRGQYGYGIGLNSAWVGELLGHVREAPAKYDWGTLGTGGEKTTLAPTGLAGQLWADATLERDTWTNFFEGEVLEYISTSPGGILIADTTPEVYRNQHEEKKAGKRPYLRFVPMSNVLDGGRNARGWWWIKLQESSDDRKPGDENDSAHEVRYLYYELRDNDTWIWRTNKDDELIGPETNLGPFVDRELRPTLPIVAAHLGRHPTVPFVGAGLLMSLADIVIDMFNVLSETRESFRDAAFSVITHAGEDCEKVLDYFKKGSRFIPLGNDVDSKLERVAGDVNEVTAGMELIRLGVQAWALSARRKAAEAATDGNAQARSGVSLQAEFQLDAKPLLVRLTEKLDEIESNAMFLVAQLAGKKPDVALKLSVKRSTSFRLEEEAARITRLISDFVATLPLTPTMKKLLISSWADASGLFDMEAKVEGAGTVREVIAEEAEEVADREEEMASRRLEAMSQPLNDPLTDADA